MNIFMASERADSNINPLRFELVLPAYNEEKSLSRLIARYAAAAASAHFTPESFQLIIVDNGSTDGSARVLNDLKKSPNGAWFRTVTVPINKGYGHGLWTGLQTTTAPVVGMSHADEQCAPEDVFIAEKRLRESGKNALVKGVRSGRNWKDRFVSRVFEGIARLRLNLNTYEINAQPKIFPRAMLASFREPPTTFAFDLYVMYQAQKNGYETVTIPVLFPPRVHGASRWAATFFSRYKTILGIIDYMGRLAQNEGRLTS
jgi:glycosyltransferase involved in cell wall biosynthesis